MIGEPEPMLSPGEIARLDTDGIDQLLDRLEAQVPVHPPFVSIPRTDGEALVFGDTHGDLPSTSAVLEEWQGTRQYRMLIGLGDYVDRTPSDVPHGSALNALYLLEWAARFPYRVLLLAGNHEMARRIPVLPSDLPGEVDDLWGPEPERHLRIQHLLERGPIAAATESGVYLAHAGFPRHRPRGDWTRAFDPGSLEVLTEVLWAECGASTTRRRVAPAFTEPELKRFLSEANLVGMLRGHDPDLTGQTVFGGRCLTLHTTRHYADLGRVIAARLPLEGPVESVGGLDLVTFDPVPE